MVEMVWSLAYAHARSLGSSRESARNAAAEAVEDFRAWSEGPAPAEPPAEPPSATREPTMGNVTSIDLGGPFRSGV